MSGILSTIYTLSQTHCGTGQAARAVDLPIAREASTGLPILPATTLKGAARATIEAAVAEAGGTFGEGEKAIKREDVIELFGAELIAQSEGEDDLEESKLSAGTLVVGEGHLLVYPFRALQQPLVFGTCPLMLERLDRALRSNNLARSLSTPDEDLEGRDILAILREARDVGCWVLPGKSGPMVLEDRIFTAQQVKPSPVVTKVGELLAGFLPTEESATATRLKANLAIVHDDVFCQLITRVTPVQARIKLTSGKTTSVYVDPATGKEERGNLWYEETLPSDCLFWSLLRHRTGRPVIGNRKVEDRFLDAAAALRYLQLGGNETVGQGQCLWHFPGGQI